MGRKGDTACNQESVMVDLMKILPSKLFVTSKSVNSGAFEVSPEVSMGNFPLENHGAA